MTAKGCPNCVYPLPEGRIVYPCLVLARVDLPVWVGPELSNNPTIARSLETMKGSILASNVITPSRTVQRLGEPVDLTLTVRVPLFANITPPTKSK